jgi:ribosomal protein S18 acetylase RimI-like enzyme
MKNLKIRAATLADLGSIAELVYSAGPAHYDYMHATATSNSLDYIRHEFASGRGFVGYRNVTVAEKDGQVIATGCFYNGRVFHRLMLGTVLNMFSFYGPLKVWMVMLRGHQVDRVMSQPGPRDLYLSSFGVAPTQRSTGVGSAMIQLKVDQARQSGHRAFTLDVADDNPRAEALYARLGLQITQRRKFSGHRRDITVPNSKKMALVL